MQPASINLHHQNRLSPFRYPGGKAYLYHRLEAALDSMKQTAPNYVEPYAGGAGAALLLLAAGKVSAVHLNDADRCVYAAWIAMLRHSDRFMDAIKQRPVDMTTWHQAREIVTSSDASTDEFELGFATYFLNRTNRSGILRGAGPIGGYAQQGQWKLDARFYKDSMIKRIQKLKQLASKITISNKDGLEFIKQSATTLDLDSTFYFIDPPYVKAGQRLYLNAMTTESHLLLAEFLKNNHLKNWLLTYDDCDIIRTAYQDLGFELVEIPYSLQKKRIEKEILVQRLDNT